MTYFLVKKSKYFYDGHGEGDYAGTTKEISTDPDWGELKEGEEYIDMWGEYVKEEDAESISSSDGYNSEHDHITVKKLKEEEALEIKKAIEIYNSI